MRPQRRRSSRCSALLTSWPLVGLFRTGGAILTVLLDMAELSARVHPRFRKEDVEVQTLEDVGLRVGDRIVASASTSSTGASASIAAAADVASGLILLRCGWPIS